MSCPFGTVKQLRSELEALPSRMLSLPVDDRGYVVPWFVDWIDGKPEFRAMNPEKWIRAIKNKLCWVCGERLDVWNQSHVQRAAVPSGMRAMVRAQLSIS
jgi:hypothetical protein